MTQAKRVDHPNKEFASEKEIAKSDKEFLSLVVIATFNDYEIDNTCFRK